MRKLAYIFGIALFLFGCGTGKYTIDVSYDPIDYPQQLFTSKDKRPVLFIDPVKDNREFAENPSAVFLGAVMKNGRFKEDPKLIRFMDGSPALSRSAAYRTSKSVPDIIDEALEREARRFGIETTKDKGLADGVLNASIEKFVVLGSTATIKINLKLYHIDFNSPAWSGILKGTSIYSEKVHFASELVLSELNTALNNAIKQWYSYPGFQEAMVSLAGNVSSPSSPQPPAKQTPQSGSGSGFFVSKLGHVITNAHVVQNCKKVTIGDNANKQVPAEIINTDRSNDLALLKLSTLEMASAESKSLIQKLSIVVVPLASKGLLRAEDVKLGEKVLVAGYPFGDFFSNTLKVTAGIVSATRGAGDDSGQFQLDAAVQPGNSGGPIYDSSGNIVGVVISQLDKLKVAKAIGSLPENVNFGIKASTVRQFLTSSGLPSKKSERTEEKSTEQLAEIAQNQALMVMCLQ